MKRIAIVSVLTGLVVVGCQDAGLVTDVGSDSPSFRVSDGATGGNRDFWFLPPVASNPRGKMYFEPSEFNATLDPLVRICPVTAAQNASPGYLCPSSGSLEGFASLNGNHYQFDWRTKKKVYDVFRVEVLLGSTLRLGFFDAQVTKKGKNADDDNVAVQAGSTVPVKFSIENDAGCIALNPAFDQENGTCATSTLPAGGSLALKKNGHDAAIANVNNGGTINATFCTDLRDRDSKEEGRVDIPTFGPCVEIENLEDFTISGTATLCEALDLAIMDEGLSETQAERMTVHRHGDNDVFGAVALPHSDALSCQEQAFRINSNRMERLARMIRESLRSTLLAARDKVLAFVGPQPLMACNRGGCGSPTDFQSSFQVALPTWMEPDSTNLDGDLGTWEEGDIVTGRVRTWDSGEANEIVDEGYEAVDSVRLSVKLADGSPGTLSCPSTDYCIAGGDSLVIFTHEDGGEHGVGLFDLEVGVGTNVVEVSGIGVGTDSVVYGPPIDDEEAAEVTLGVGTLSFTAESAKLVGSAAIIDDDVIRLTPADTSKAGAAWLQDKKTLAGGFTASFSFRISDTGGLMNTETNDSGNDGADGIAFVIQDDQYNALGSVGGGIGYDGVPRSLAVEFDTWLNPGTVNDPNGNHISVHTNGTSANSYDEVAAISPGAVDAAPVTLSDGAVHTVVIDYTPGTLNVTLDGSSVLTVSVDLDGSGIDILDGAGKAWVGFTGATGAAFEKHDVFDIKIEIP